MSAYGKNTKRIVFTETDHRHAKLLIRLNHDGLKQSQFFRSIVTGYLDGDPRIQDFIEETSTVSKIKKQKSKNLRSQGDALASSLGLGESEIENIFDIIKEEHPDL